MPLARSVALRSALLYAERTRSHDAFEGVLRQLRRTAMGNTRAGPVWLGYRLGE